MHRYEDKNIQTKALSLIPVLLLEQRAQERMRMLQKDVKKGMSVCFLFSTDPASRIKSHIDVVILSPRRNG